MFILDWYKQYLEIRESYKTPQICESCETLKSQLAYANHEKEKLLARVMEKPEPIPERTTAPPMENKPVRPSVHMPWRVRQQMLEANDREKARAMRDAPKPDTTNKTEIDAFEQEVKDAERAREASTGSPS